MRAHHKKSLFILSILVLCLSAGCGSRDTAPEPSASGKQPDTTGIENRRDPESDSSHKPDVDLKNARSRQIGLARSLMEQHVHYDADRILQAVAAGGADDSLVADLLTANLLSWARRALRQDDSAQFAECMLRLVEGSLPDTLLPVVGGMLGLSYPITQVTDNVVADYAPRFFPDGRTMAYFSRLEREALEYPGYYSVRYQTQICTVGINGEEPTVISDGEASDFYPDVSPDGRYIVCQRAHGDTLKEEWMAAAGSYIYLYDLENGQDRRLGGDRLYGRCPRFTPAGDAIVFQTSHLGREGWICTIDLETETLTPRYRSASVLDFERPLPFFPSFFPDGERLVFQTGLWERKLIYVADAYGRELIRLTPDTLDVYTWGSYYAAWDASERHPAVSPDGQMIVFVSEGWDGQELFLRRPDETTRRQITFDGYDKAYPAYSPDGRFIAYGAKRSEYPDTDYEIYMLDLAAPVIREQVAVRARKLAGRLGIER